MSVDDQHALGKLNRYELSILIALGFMMIFAGLIIFIIYKAKIDFSITGTIDVNLIWVTFLTIVTSISMWLGIRTRSDANVK